MKRGKKGQFYILAAIVIVTLIAGFAAVNNFAQKRSSVQLYDVGEELNIESSKVLDYGVSSDDNLADVVDDFTSKYDEYAGEDREIYFIFGDIEEIIVVTYSEVSGGNVQLIGGAGEGQIGQDIPVTKGIKTLYNPDCTQGNICEVKVKIGDDVYDFELKPGENFYFIISQVVGDEQVVITG